jgi:DNA-binding beta-propeller fold protein YncE
MLRIYFFACLILAICVGTNYPAHAAENEAARAADGERHLLYVATPGVRNYLEYGGHGLVVFDMDDGHKFVKRIPTGGYDQNGKPLNVKGICAHAASGRIYISTTQQLLALDLVSEKLLWELRYEGGCDRMSITPDGKTIYLPSLEKAHWHVVNAAGGEVMKKIVPNSGSHNTVVALDGRLAFLAGLRSPLLTVVDTSTNEVIKTVGPFAAPIRPFTVNGKSTVTFVNINGLLGFEVGDITTGKKLHRVEVAGYKQGPIKRHGCPSHGVGLTPDEREVWVVDAANQSVHIFDATVMPPKQLESIKVKDEPGWVTFSIDGKYAYPSTGDVIDTKTRKIITELKDETGAAVQSEKMIEIVVKDGKPIRNGNQFGVGRVASSTKTAATGN